MVYLRYFVSNALFAALVYAALSANVQGAWNVMAFAVWGYLVLAVLAVLTSTPRLKVDNRLIVADRCFDAAIVFALAWYGEFVLATAYAAHALLLFLAINADTQRKWKLTTSLSSTSGPALGARGSMGRTSGAAGIAYRSF